ncbi:MAG: YihY/virulence factor BrkB family protein [Prevotella ruminicola]|jgi:membrane protein|uniref:YihY/virulence factor BrkB family protein n=1 Tax=Xylanibacter ruminicola TaxID=839 RepID=A0A9D5NY95_XYLRU|nr:YihY/virulence factor BrkB family protein [Xylanibacter ruminicola]
MALRKIYRTLVLTIRFFTTKRVMTQASALTYSTLLAIVPILAVIFAIARGFGYNKYIEIWFRDALSSQPQVADILTDFVNSYLIHTQSGIFLGVGLLFMLYTVLMLVNNVEETFNEIWQVSNARPLMRSLTNYMAMFFVFPIIIVVSMGLSIFMATVAKHTDGVLILGPAVRSLLDFSPYLLLSLLFIGLYVYMPNTDVKLKSAIVPGILSGIAMQLLQLFYIHSQIWVTGYNAIYGSFAALPLFMLWLQISWTICLFGAQLTFTNQNLDRIGINLDEINMHPLVDMTDDETNEAARELYSDRLDSL